MVNPLEDGGIYECRGSITNATLEVDVPCKYMAVLAWYKEANRTIHWLTASCNNAKMANNLIIEAICSSQTELAENRYKLHVYNQIELSQSKKTKMKNVSIYVHT